MDGDLLIIFGTIFAIVIGSQLISLAKKWIDRNKNSYDEQAFDRMAKAFIKYKKESERRLQNLEAIITDEEPKSESSSTRQLEETQLHNTIEIDADDSETEEKSNQKESNGGNLRNMLKE